MNKIVRQRLCNQQLVSSTLKTPREVVACLGAVQAQEFVLSRWALGLRLPGATEADILNAFDSGEILRTHALRPTWQYVMPQDIRWILELTAPRVHALNAMYYRRTELDATLMVRINDIFVRALEGGNELTRSELGEALERVGIPMGDTVRMSYIMMQAELEALLCSGARRGSQSTYALLDERAPDAKRLSRDHALAELTKRYFRTRGLATVHDFTVWSGLTVADARAGLAMWGEQFVSEAIDGKTYWYDPAMPIAPADAPELRQAFFLPPFDEFAMPYKDYSPLVDSAHLPLATRPLYNGVMVIDCQVVGNWKRTLRKNEVLIETAAFRPLTAGETESFQLAAQRFGEFLGLPTVLRIG